MHPSQIPEKPVKVGLGKVENAERVYFFERENNTIFSCSGREAWTILQKRNQIIGRERPRMKFVGSSTGEVFRQAVMDSQKAFREQGLEASQEIIRKGELAELEVAKGNLIYPPNFDTVTNGGVPITLSSLR